MKMLAAVIILAVCLMTGCGRQDPIWAAEKLSYSPHLWQGLLAEASGEGETGMYAVCCVCRNRLKKGMDLGLVGLKRLDLAKFVAKEGYEREVMAKRIVEAVFEQGGPDTTKGALYFENTKKYGKPQWAAGKVVTVKIKNHVFYK